ncbi:uncharacterized protein LOC131941473 [Physella acuta]|uniref:uncharacterized protein LOC131941472 n=1 Tax=Physella acuta TaxID=109671 RepID=UPI0027DE9C95|nr:uncharacterized protein LOC131941472 [Physella acuta]XP_059156733.1 uncharacterized protein LOC131941473 [Physella acuta]
MTDVSSLTLTPHKVTSDPSQRAALILKEQNVTSDTVTLPGHVRTVEVCCHDTPEPCVGHLSADNLTVSSNTTCVSYGITRHTTTYLTYSYTICGLASSRRFTVLVDGHNFSASTVKTTSTPGGVSDTETISSFTIDGRTVVNNTTGITLYTDTDQEKSTVLVVALSVSIALLVLLLLALLVFYICKGKRLLQNLTEMVGGSESAKIPRTAGDDVTTEHVYESVIYTDTAGVRVDVWQTDMTDSSLIKLDTSLANDEYIIPSDLV